MIAVVLSLFLGAIVASNREVIVNVRVATQDDALGTIEDGFVAIENGEIVAVGPMSEFSIGNDEFVHDGLGRTVIPGLFDLHVHLDGGGFPEFDRDPDRAAVRSLACGVTSVLDLNGEEAAIFALRDRERADPGIGSSRIFAVGSAFSVDGGHGTQGDYPARRLAPESELPAQLDALVAAGASFAKIMVDAGGYGGEPRRNAPTRAEIARFVELSHERGLRVIAHVVEVERAREAVEVGVDVLAHLPFIGDADDSFLALLAERKTVVFPTLAAYAAQIAYGARSAASPRERERAAFFESRRLVLRDLLLRAHAHGVSLLPGSDAGAPGNPHGDALLAEFQQWKEAGIPPAAILRAATRGAAEFLRVGDRLGRVAPGCAADLLLVEGNPSNRVVEFVRIATIWKAGRSVPRAVVEEARRGDPPALPFRERRGWLDFEEYAPPATPLGECEAFLESPLEREDARVTARIVDAREDRGETRFLRLEGALSERPAAEFKAGVSCDGRARLPETGLLGFESLRLRARAEGVSRFRILLVESPSRDLDWYGRTIAVGSEFETVEIPFAEFTQIGFGDRRPLDLASIVGVAIVTENDAIGRFRIDVDDLEIVR